MRPDLLPSITRTCRRRWFLTALTGTGIWSWLATQDALAARPTAAKRPLTSPHPRSWSLWLDFLIPADELTPSATALNIDRELWQEVVKDPVYEKLARFGCAWIDRYHPLGFAGLDADEQQQLAVWMSQAPWESPHRRFFDLVRDHATTLYYSQPAARRYTLLEHPPQPMGRALDLPSMPVMPIQPEAPHA